MASGSQARSPDQSLPEFLTNSGVGGIPLLLPFLFGVAAADQPGEGVVITQTMVVVEGSGSGSGSGDDLMSPKSVRRPASKASIDAMPAVEVENCDEQCAVCLEACETAKEMPCKHRFHAGCIERWLNVSASCPVCRYQMPEAEEENNRDQRERRRGVWLSFSFARTREDDIDSDNRERNRNDSSQNHTETED